MITKNPIAFLLISIALAFGGAIIRLENFSPISSWLLTFSIISYLIFMAEMLYLMWKQESENRLTWILMTIIVPSITPIFYLFLNLNRK